MTRSRFLPKFSLQCIAGAGTANAGLAILLAVHSAGPLWGQSFAPCSTGSSNICASPSTASVGIGTTSPAVNLEVQGTAAQLFVTNSDTTNTLALGGWNGTSQSITSINLGTAITPLQIQAAPVTVTNPYSQTYPLIVQDTAMKNDASSYVGLQLQTSDSAPLTGSLALYTSTTPGNRYLRIGAYENGFGWRNTAFYGNVGIGTTNPQSALAVDGTITTKEVVVTGTGWPDYVFAPDYPLAPLSDVAAYVKENHHLPDIPSAAEVLEKGVNLGDMQAKLLAKVEELTLHLIADEKRISELESVQSKAGDATRAGKTLP